MEINTLLLVAAILTGSTLIATLVLAFNGKALQQLNNVRNVFSGIAAAFATYKENRRDEEIAKLIGAVDSDVTSATRRLKQATATVTNKTKALAKLKNNDDIARIQDLLLNLEAEFATYTDAKAELFGLFQAELLKLDPILKQKVKNKGNNSGNNNSGGGNNNNQGGDKTKEAKEQARTIAEEAGLAGPDKGKLISAVMAKPDEFLAKSKDEKLAFAKTFKATNA
jgi:hypothetical protein